MKNWKTSLSGIMAIVVGGWAIAQPTISGQAPSQEAVQGGIGAILAGIGLLVAKDHNVSGTGKP